MKLQYQLSNGAWVDCADRTDEFLSDLDRFSGLSNRAEIISALSAGKQLRNDSADWYSNCRDIEAIEALRAAMPEIKIEMVKCSCGHTVPKHQRMSTSTGSSCPDCYDRMSF